MTLITIPDSVTSIGNEAFSWCESLASIAIPGSVTSIGEETFKSCKNLKRIIIPDALKKDPQWREYKAEISTWSEVRTAEKREEERRHQ